MNKYYYNICNSIEYKLKLYLINRCILNDNLSMYYIFLIHQNTFNFTSNGIIYNI